MNLQPWHGGDPRWTSARRGKYSFMRNFISGRIKKTRTESWSLGQKNVTLKLWSVESRQNSKKFELQGDGDNTLVVELWLHRVADDLSGLTFQEWDPSAGSDDTSAPVAMLVNSSDLCATDFPSRKWDIYISTRWIAEAVVAAVRKLQGVGNSTFVLSVENDNDFRSRCEWIFR